MAAYQLTIQAENMIDLDAAISTLYRRFQGLPQRLVPTSGETVDGEEASGAEGQARPRGRPRGTGKRVSPAQGEGAAGTVPAADAGDAEAGGHGADGAAAGGTSGAVESGPAAEGQVDAGAAEAPAQAGEDEDIFAQAEAAEAAQAAEDRGVLPEVGAEVAGNPAGVDAEQVPQSQDQQGDADGAAALGVGTVDLDAFKAAVKTFIETKGFSAAQAILKKHSVSKPGACPEDKRAAVMADLQEGMR